MKNYVKNFPEEDIIYFNVKWQNDENLLIIKGPEKNNITFNNIFGPWCHQGMFISRKLFDKYGFYNEEYKIAADWVFILFTLGLNNASFKYLDMIVCCFDGKGISSNSNIWSTERNIALEKYLPKRVLDDYKTGYLNMAYRLNKYRLSWFLLRVLNKCAIYYEKILRQ